jgi:hypothetical protein
MRFLAMLSWSSFRCLCALGALGMAALIGCGDGSAAQDAALSDAPPDALAAADASLMPQSLRDTGLYIDFDNQILAEGVREFRPAYELWSDGADKQRWVHLPAGAVIDSSDMDFWQYPAGTKLWKQFTRDGVRVETRLLYKTGPDRFDWFMMPYVWNEAQTEALAAPGGVDNALGTDHDVPNSNDCTRCHDRMPDVAIGFSALLLDHDPGNGPNGVTLADLVQESRLSVPPQAAEAPYFGLPGDATAQAALGYVHVNCGNCHHPRSDVMDNTTLDLRLAVAELAAVEDTAIFTSAVNVPPQLNAGPEITALIEPGDPAASAVHARMNRRGATTQMPPIATEQVDSSGLSVVDAWILSLPPDP